MAAIGDAQEPTKGMQAMAEKAAAKQKLTLAARFQLSAEVLAAFIGWIKASAFNAFCLMSSHLKVDEKFVSQNKMYLAMSSSPPEAETRKYASRMAVILPQL